TPQVQTTTYSPIRPPLITRTCLADTNSDRIFDHLAYIQLNVSPTRAVSRSWETPVTPHVSGGAVTSATAPIASPVPYTPLQPHRAAPVQRDRPARIVGATASPELRTRGGDATVALSDQRGAVQAVNRPRTLTFNGAQAELQSLES